MSLIRIELKNVRNLSEARLTPKACNLILGENGSGKTSLLEAIHLLFRGKSFRHFEARHLIRFGQDELLVFAELESGTRLGVQKTKGDTQIRLNGQQSVTQSELTRLVPVCLIDPAALDLLDQGTSSRRKLLDWLCFHVDPKFYRLWLDYTRLNKQRTSLLKRLEGQVLDEESRAQLLSWSEPLATLGEALTSSRLQVFNLWRSAFLSIAPKFLPRYHSDDEALEIEFSAGYDQGLGFFEVLQQRLQKDVEQGLSRVGPQRADVRVKLGKLDATNVLSRGEKKLLITALKVSQLMVLTELEEASVVLLDDLTAELDQHSVERLLAQLKQWNAQLCMTSLEADLKAKVVDFWAQDAAVFRIASGKICQEASVS